MLSGLLNSGVTASKGGSHDMKKAHLTVQSNLEIADRIYKMVLKGELVRHLNVLIAA
jgi:hypothetical protein